MKGFLSFVGVQHLETLSLHGHFFELDTDLNFTSVLLKTYKILVSCNRNLVYIIGILICFLVSLTRLADFLTISIYTTVLDTLTRFQFKIFYYIIYLWTYGRYFLSIDFKNKF